jgi:hypothetical protein
VAHHADSSVIAERTFGLHRGTYCSLSELLGFNKLPLLVGY